MINYTHLQTKKWRKNKNHARQEMAIRANIKDALIREKIKKKDCTQKASRIIRTIQGGSPSVTICAETITFAKEYAKNTARNIECCRPMTTKRSCGPPTQHGPRTVYKLSSSYLIPRGCSRGDWSWANKIVRFWRFLSANKIVRFWRFLGQLYFAVAAVTFQDQKNWLWFNTGRLSEKFAYKDFCNVRMTSVSHHNGILLIFNIT